MAKNDDSIASTEPCELHAHLEEESLDKFLADYCELSVNSLDERAATLTGIISTFPKPYQKNLRDPAAVSDAGGVASNGSPPFSPEAAQALVGRCIRLLPNQHSLVAHDGRIGCVWYDGSATQLLRVLYDDGDVEDCIDEEIAILIRNANWSP